MKEEIDKLLKIKDRIEQKSKEKERITGKLETIEKSFKDYNCANVDQAIKNESALVDSIKVLEDKIKTGIQKLVKDYADLVKE